jgi:hypothetical protein
VTLPDGAVAVSTNQGLRFYSPASRSWFRRVLRDPIPAGSRSGELYVTDRYMVSVTEKGEDLELSTVELGSFRLPASHTDDPVLLGGTLRKVRALTVDPVGGRMAFIDRDGTIFEWHGGVELEMLPPTKNEPLSSSLNRVYERISITGKFGQSGFLLFTTDTMKTLQRYDLDRRSWSEIRLNIPALPGDDSLADMDISNRVDQTLEYIVAKSRKGKFFTGSFVSPKDARDVKRVELRPLFSPGTGLDAPGSDLRDVQQRGQGYWTFILSGRIKYYDPVKRQWSEEILLPGMKSFTYYHLQDRGVIVSDSPGANEGQTWWVAHQAGPHPLTFAGYTLKPGETETTALDHSGTIWRLPPGGTLYRVPLPARGNYDPSGTVHEIPFAVDSRKIKGAYEWGRRILFDTPEGIRVLDTVLRKEIPLKGPAGNLTGIKEALAEERQVWIRTGTDRLLLLVIMADSSLECRVLPGTTTALTEAVERIQGAAPGRRLENKWGRLKQKVVRLANGQEAYDPVLGLVGDKTGALMMRRPGGPEQLAAHGALEFGPDKLAPALDAGWLRWKRNTRTFEIKTPTKTLTMTPDEFIKDKKLLFEDIDAILARDTNRWCTANRHGIWNHTGKDLSLADPALTFQPMSWSPPLGAVHGVFITGDGLADADGKAVPAARQDHRVVFGDVTLIENIARGGIRARIKIAGKPGSIGSIDGFASRGFTWDRQKRGLAYGGAGLLVHSDAGIHPVESFTGFEAPPDRAARGQLYSRETGKLYVRQGQTWFRRSGPSQWTQTTANPRENRVLVDNATWKWELRNNELHVQLTGDPYDFKLIPGTAGFAFTADLLGDAAAFNNRVMVMSAAFCEEASPASQLTDFQASRSRALPCRSLRVIRYASGPDDLLLYTADGKEYYRWDIDSRRFEPVKDIGLFLGNSLLAAVPAAKPGLRFLRQASGANGKIKKELRVNNTAGILSWEPFDFQGIDNHFPFDGVTAIAAGKDELYVGTEAGLQVYAGNLDTGLGDIRSFYEFRGKSRGSPGLLEPVKNVGTPLNNPRVVIAYSSSQCIEKPEGGSFRVCRGGSSLDERLRFQTASWRFVERDGRVEGRYKDEKGRFSSEKIAILDGRFPHDRIGDMAVYDNHVFTLWYSGSGTSTSWISRCPTRSVAFDQKEVVNYNTGFMDALNFIEVLHDIELKGAVIAHGLYVEGRGAQIWQYSPGGSPSQSWKEVRDPGVTGGILEYANRPPIVTRKAFRLLTPEQNKRSTPGQGVFTFEYRALDGQWRPLPWETGKNKVCIDHWTTFFCLDGRLWAAAPCGLVSFSRDPRGNVVLDPDNFMVVPEPAIGDTILPVTAVTVENHKKKSVIIRCPGGAPYGYTGILDGKTDRDVFMPVPGPAAGKEGKEVLMDTRREKVQVGLGEEDNGFWEWVTMTTGPADTDTQPGRLKGRLRGEEIRLVGGRFAFDGINSIAFFQKDRVEIGTDSGGWYQVTLPAEEWQGAGDFHLSRFQRPRTPGVNPALVKEVRTNRTGAEQNEQVLGLRVPGEGFIRLGKEGVMGRTETFPQFLGSDGFWQYLKVDSDDVGQDSLLSIIALNPSSDKKSDQSGAGGRAKRRLETGRFTDDIVLGLPVGDTDESGVYYLVPTRAGVLRLDSALNPLNIYTTASLNVPGGVSSSSASSSAPAVLFVDRRSTPQKPLYLDRDGFHTLTEPGASPYLNLTPHVPPGAVVMAVEEGPQDFVRARWKIGESNQPGKQPGQRDYEKEQRGWVLFDTGKEKPRHEEPNTLYVNLRDFKAFRKSRQSQPWMRVRFTANQVEFLRYGSEQPYKMNLPEPLELLAAFVKDKRLLLIGRTHLWEINLERVVE